MDKNYQYNNAELYLEIAGVMFIAIDTDAKITLVNPKACEILGYTKEELIGMDWFDNFIDNINRMEVRGIFEKIINGEIEKVEYFENPIQTKNGERFISWHNTTIKDNGKIVGILSSGEDITETKKLKEKTEIQIKISYFTCILCII